MAASNNIQALQYIVYMMIGSYYKKATCTSSIREKINRIAYCEMKSNTQESTEERVDNYFNDFIKDKLEEKGVLDEEVEVTFLDYEGRSKFGGVEFRGEKYTLEFTFDLKKKSRTYSYRITETMYGYKFQMKE